MEKIKPLNRMNWRQKVLLSILGSFIIIISFMFYITYHYFVEKVEAGNERLVLLNFEQAEKDLENILKNAELCLNKYVISDLVWEFGYEYPNSNIDESRLKMKISESFHYEMLVNREISALGILKGDGVGIVSSALGKNRTGDTEISGEILNVLQKVKENYPYTTWVPSWELDINDTSPFKIMSQTPSLVGIKAVGVNINLEEESFIFVAINEIDIQSTYRAVALNDSRAILVDKKGQIISDVDKSMLGKEYYTGTDTQNIEYPLDFYGWKLCDMIPKEEYLKDANEIRDFGIIVIMLAIVATVTVAVIWSRKYTQPIELLMKNMHHIKNQEFNIDKPKKLGWEELDRLNEELYSTAQSIKAYIERLKQVEDEKRREELMALQYQMNPHFLLNSLNSIRWMAMMTNNTIVADTLVRLGKIITPVLRNPSLTWKVKNEVEFLENYAAMMQLRYGHDMEYKMSCKKELYELEFPRFILQPLIENCFVHGSSQEEIRTIEVVIECNDYMDVKVINSGIFLNEEELSQIRNKIKSPLKTSEHIGLANVSKRLGLLYGDKGSMSVETDPKLGLIVHIRFNQYVEMTNKERV